MQIGNIETDGFEYEVVIPPQAPNHFKKVYEVAEQMKKKRDIERMLREQFGRGVMYIPESRKRSLYALISKSYTPRCDR